MYQQITLVGNLGSDPEMRYTPAGIPVTTFSLAVNKSWTNAEGKRQDKALWFRVTAWRKLAEVASEYLAKGRQVLVVGEIEEPHIWTDKQNNNRVTLEVTAQTIKFMGTKGETAAGAAVTGDMAALPDKEIPF